MNLVEKLNKIDHYCLDNNLKFRDLKSLYEAISPKFTPKDKAELQKVVAATNDPAVIEVALQKMTNESMSPDEIEYAVENGKPFELGDYWDSSSYVEVDHKMVQDSDGFYTDYTMYQDMDTGEYVCVFGDKDFYGPEDGDWDAGPFDTEEEAREWFDNYNGFEDESLDESFDGVKSDAESIERFLTDNNFGNYELVDYEDYPLETSKIDFEVSGDWKHDHLRFKNLINKWAKENNRNIFKIDEKEIGHSDSDDYTAQYSVFVAKDKDSLDMLNSFKGLFSENLDESFIDVDKTIYNKPIKYRGFKIKQMKPTDEFLSVFDSEDELEDSGFLSVRAAADYIDYILGPSEDDMYDDWQKGNYRKFNKFNNDEDRDDYLPFESLKENIDYDLNEELSDIEKKCRDKFKELKHILLDGVEKTDNCEDSMALQRVNNAFKAVDGKSDASQDSPTYVRYDGRVGDYTVGGSISGKGYILGDLNRLAEDLTMAYNVMLGGDREYIPNFIKKITNINENLNIKTATDVVRDLYDKYPNVEFLDERDLDDGKVALFFRFSGDVSGLEDLVKSYGIDYKIKDGKMRIIADEDEYLDESLNEDLDTKIKEDVNSSDAWSYEEVEEFLNKYTNKFSKESSITAYIESEKDLAKNVLKKYYKIVEVSDGRRSKGEDMKWVISFAEPKNK